MKRKIISTVITAAMLSANITIPVLAESGVTAEPIYLDTSYSFEERAADLVSRMTLEEKVAQLGYTAPSIERLGVSSYNYWKECLHGVARQGKATNYPASLALSNTWNRNLIYTVADETSTEARAKNNRYNLSYYTPTINMARDPRWGRNEETYGEDPYLTGQLGAEFVKGMQGDDDTYTKIIATIKHFAANNNEKNRRSGSSYMTEFNLRNYYTKVFRNVTEQVMPGSVMSSYNATSISRGGIWVYNFRPSSSNPYLLTDLLRRSWGFDGYVTTDCGAGNDLASVSQYKQGALGATDLPAEAYVAEALKSGMDLECNLSGGNTATAYGVKAVEEGYITEQQLETAIYHLFLQRFRTGEFDSAATTYRGYTSSDIESDAHIATAEKAAEESWVLLKNDDILPLADSVTNVAVVGSLANRLVLGDYTGTPDNIVTPIDGITSELGKNNVSVKHVGVVADDEKLYNVKSIKLVASNGKETSLDLSKAESVKGMELADGTFKNVTPQAGAVIKNVNFENIVSVKVEMATGNMWGGSLNIAYGQGGPTVAAVSSSSTADDNTYAECIGAYTGADGGYNGTVDMYISASAAVRDFSVSEFKSDLDSADVIIAYAGTIPKQDGFGDADSSESKDRESIDLPSHQAHVQAICDAYPKKTIVAASTVGQINVEPFMDKCKAILWTSYNGQVQGTALGKILAGTVNPSGRLSTTWYKNADVAKMELYNNTDQTIGGIKGKFTNYNIQADGTNPGHTYMYYSGTPVYPFGYGLSYTSFEYSDMTVDKTETDANGIVTASIKVKNTGSSAGAEVVQLYAAHPQDGNANTPKKQLKGFEKIELAAGEEKNVTFELNMKDMALFDETAQKDVVPAGEYTLYIAKNAEDTSNSKAITVSGTLASTLKTVKAMPDGVTVNGLICEDGTGLETKTAIDPKVSAVMSDEQVIDNPTVVLTSSDESVAKIEDGKVVSGGTAGVAVITASVTVGGETKTDSFPVVNVLSLKPTDSEIEAAKAELKAAYEQYPKSAYSDDNYAVLTGLYNTAVSAVESSESKDALTELVKQAKTDMAAVPLDALSESYTISSENKNILVNGIIDYRSGGIPLYSGASGTITNAKPYTAQLIVSDADGGTPSGIIWQIQKLDASSREVADINSETGELTIYGNGIVEITAADLANLKCARQVIYINTQIEGEYADNGNGANLADAQKNTSNGLDVGSSSKYWIEYKGVKLSMLESILLRYSLKNGSQTVNISLDQSTAANKLIASATVSATGAWNTWDDAELEINSDVIDNAALDEYGCAAVYIQTNGANLDYFKLAYTEYNDEVPYAINKVTNKNGGKMTADLKYRGSAAAKDVKLTAEVLNDDGTVKSTAEAVVSGTGEYEIETGAANGETVRLTVKDGESILSESTTKVYRTPAESSIVAYYLDSTDYDYTILTGGTANVKYDATVNGLSGYGVWNLKGKNQSYTYTDVNDKEYKYTFTKVWQGGRGNTSNLNLFFTPSSQGRVTVVFDGNGSAGREMTIYQSDKNQITGQSIADGLAEVSLELTDTSAPVYIYGGGSNKNIYAIIVEYYGKTEEPTTEPTTPPTEPPTATPTATPTVPPTAPPTATPTIPPTTPPTQPADKRPVTVGYDPAEKTVTLTASADIEKASVLKAVYNHGILSGVNEYEVEFNNGSAEITDVSLNDGDKLLVWESLSNILPYSDVFEYEAEDIDISVQSLDWEGNIIELTQNTSTGNTKVWNVMPGGKAELSTNLFYSAPEGYATSYPEHYFTINALDTYKSRMFAGCDGGFVIMFTDCAKCYQLKKPVDFDIKEMSIEDGIMTVSDGVSTENISMSELGGDEMEADDAKALADSGRAVLIDLREAEDYENKHYSPSVNIPINSIEDGLAEYGTDTTLIFVCYSGVRSAKAIETAKLLGFDNTYNAGGIDKLL